MQIHITLRQLQVFVAVTRHGSVSAAAREIGLSQSAASQGLSELERHLEVQLFERLGRRLALNANGRRLLARAEQLLEQTHALELEAREPGVVDGNLRGELEIAASATIGTWLLPGLAGAFMREHPGTELNLRLRNTHQVVEAVLNYDAELGLIEGDCHAPRLMSQTWREDELVVVAPPSHPLAMRGTALSDEDLATADWILREGGSGTRAVFERALHGRIERLKVRMELGQHEAIKQAVFAGLGLGCLSRLSVAAEIARGELVVLATPQLNLKRRFSMLWHPERYRSPLWQAVKVYLEASPR
ncbi:MULTISPECIES: LysR substrate-binding domain-containing protein [Cobetia]|uniref:LysR substrate-binding domain-containing protein n=1 Tax=Cobetia TaxID=204286 RepID=UPI0015815F4C|nr:MULTISPECIES: LysR substrate-binding domain-containing protein [Cobetia]NVN55426.1 LysR family transcriptional regulator [bacterium Scap17]MCO7231808.1 LysR substrate-binding domain-containing protein [Cobetia sp. Dlab-2-AX]MCO7234876.1 LysR substrate-binding domain-containing protein [Cobetia sp. Dlab-2-U]MDI4660814.1 LysR substrate-binding domain-containing protein [Cobetia sp. BMC6]MDL2190307.1 LysR substrate-binding domain-containing protein [Cobetia sp. LC6]